MPKLKGLGIFFFTPLHRRLAVIVMRSLLPFDKFKIAWPEYQDVKASQMGRGMPKQKKPRGRPPKYPMPEPLDVDIDTLAEVVLKAKPKEVWRYEQETGRNKRSAKPD